MPRQKKNWDKEWEIPEAEQGLTYDDGFLFGPDSDDPSPVKKLKRDLEREALTHLEEAARTEADFREVVKNWDRLDDNRERRERYHEILRGNKTPPLEHNMIPDGYAFPAALNGVLARQNRKGDFLDTIYYCIYDLHELVPQEYLIAPLAELPDDRKELLFLYIIEHWSTMKIASWRKQTDRNIRKIRNTSLNRIRKKIRRTLMQMEAAREPLTSRERAFLEKEKAASEHSESGVTSGKEAIM